MRIATVQVCFLAVISLVASQVAYAGSLHNQAIAHRAAQQRGDAIENDYPAAKAVLPAGVRLLADVAYGSDIRQRMDVYLPPHPAAAAVLFMVHGGAWRFGDKSSKTVVENKVARWVPRGFIFVSIDYRMLPQADPLRQAEDVARALAAAQNKAESWGGDPAKFILVGHSAGAHLVALLAASPSKALELGARPWLGTVSLDSAALDVVQIMESQHFRFYDSAFGRDPAYWKSASPFYQLTPQAAPILLVCSSRRRDSCPQSHAFAARAGSIKVKATVVEQNLTHKEINETLGLPGSYTDAVEAFIGSLDASVKKALAAHPSDH